MTIQSATSETARAGAAPPTGAPIVQGTAPAGATSIASGSNGRPARSRKRLVLLALFVVAIIAAIVIGIPRLHYAWTHVSTDDAAIGSHVTYVSPRITGMATEVLVDDNQFVQPGTVLVRLDAAPVRIMVQQKQAALDRARLEVDQQVAALDVAQAQVEQARSQVRGEIAAARASGILVSVTRDLVRYAVASIQSAGANLAQQQANLRMTQGDVARATALPDSAMSQEDRAHRQAAMETAQAQVDSAEQSLQQSRALLGLPDDREHPTTVPSDIAQTYSGVRYAAAAAQSSFAQLGVADSLNMAIDDLKSRFMNTSDDQLVQQSPAVKVAESRARQARAFLGGEGFDPNHRYDLPSVRLAQADLDEARLQLSYTEITAPVAGFVTRREVTVGTHVDAGQNLLAICPLQNVWVEANFKETQLGDLRVGQAVDIYVDAYPGRTFRGRVGGFSPGTGSVLSMLPPENATGNYVKVVQRLPVRIELTEPISPETPLFTGLSVQPDVDITSTPTGPDAGQRLLGTASTPVATVSTETGASGTAINPPPGREPIAPLPTAAVDRGTR